MRGKCYNMYGYINPETGRTHTTICEYCDADPERECFICTRTDPPTTLYVKRLKLDKAGFEIKWIEPPVWGCPNGEPQTIVIGRGLEKE